MARPSKLTPEVQQKLCDAVRAGNYFCAACAYAQVSYPAFRVWMKRGSTASSGRYRAFVDAVKKAQADSELAITALWQAQIPQNWQAARDFLARRFPRRWGAKDALAVTGKDGAPLALTLEQKAQAERELEDWRRARNGGEAPPAEPGEPGGA